MIKNILLVGLGGGIGSVLRYAATLLVGFKKFPYATLSVNIIGSFIIGVVLAMSMKEDNFAGNWKLFLATGICGGFTTFSAFSMENMQLLQSGKTGVAFLYIILSVVLGIAATFAGYQLFKN
ncbi:MAG: fluoride efflux transporter CrcB [Ferruginibacter sp.]|nr:fluoride efflux transporter CrcB [Ferruginibacter sp.]